ncbi:hypothetical protein QYF36_017218 [Acer negundo]|nr:hypothetical protein QYF36_017218 [Acer negundo]
MTSMEEVVENLERKIDQYAEVSHTKEPGKLSSQGCHGTRKLKEEEPTRPEKGCEIHFHDFGRGNCPTDQSM